MKKISTITVLILAIILTSSFVAAYDYHCDVYLSNWSGGVCETDSPCISEKGQGFAKRFYLAFISKIDGTKPNVGNVKHTHYRPVYCGSAGQHTDSPQSAGSFCKTGEGYDGDCLKVTYKTYGITGNVYADCSAYADFIAGASEWLELPEGGASESTDVDLGKERYYEVDSSKSGTSCISLSHDYLPGTCDAAGHCEVSELGIIDNWDDLVILDSSGKELTVSTLFADGFYWGSKEYLLHKGEQYTIKAKVTNAGNTSESSSVGFFIGPDPQEEDSYTVKSASATQIGSNVPITVSGDHANWASLNWTPDSTLTTTIYAWVDPDNLNTIESEYNNLQSVTVTITDKPKDAELEILEYDITLNPSILLPNKKPELRFSFRNVGELSTSDSCTAKITFNGTTYQRATYYIDNTTGTSYTNSGNENIVDAIGCEDMAGGESRIGVITLLEPNDEGESNKLTIELTDSAPETTNTSVTLITETKGSIGCDEDDDPFKCKIDCARMFCDTTQVYLTLIKMHESGYFPQEANEKINVALWTLPPMGNNKSKINAFTDIYTGGSNAAALDAMLGRIRGVNNYTYKNDYEFEDPDSGYSCTWGDADKICLRTYYYTDKGSNPVYGLGQRGGGRTIYQIRRMDTERLSTSSSTYHPDKEVYDIHIIDINPNLRVDYPTIIKKFPYFYFPLELPLAYYTLEQGVTNCYYPENAESEGLTDMILWWPKDSIDPLAPQSLNTCKYTTDETGVNIPESGGISMKIINENSALLNLYTGIDLILDYTTRKTDVFAKFYQDMEKLNTGETLKTPQTRVWWTTEGMHIGYNE